MEIESAHPVGREQVELHGNLVEGQTVWSGLQDTWLQVRQLLWESQPFKSSPLYSEKHQRKTLWLPSAGEVPPSRGTGKQSPSFQHKGCLEDQASQPTARAHCPLGEAVRLPFCPSFGQLQRQFTSNFGDQAGCEKAEKALLAMVPCPPFLFLPY